MTTPWITAIGEVLWDMLPAGRQLGGAPANFAAHAKGLGADAALVSRVGNDALGREIRERLMRRGLVTLPIQKDAVAPTGTVDVDVDAAGQPHYTIREDAAWDRLEVDDHARASVASSSAVCFGSLGQRSPAARAAIQSLIAGARPETLRVFDVNLRSPFWTPEVVEQSLALANALKLNDQELPILAGLFGIVGDDRERLHGLAIRSNLRLVALTRGAHGSLLLADGKWSEHPGVPVVVKDAVGAGDAFTAALVMGYLRGHDLDAINDHANRVAAYVCTQPGATPELPAALVKG